jgi:hypothetical protein
MSEVVDGGACVLDLHTDLFSQLGLSHWLV